MEGILTSLFTLAAGFYEGQSEAEVTFDQHSIILSGQRQMIFSGEFHPFRLPAPELWKDVLEKCVIMWMSLASSTDS